MLYQSRHLASNLGRFYLDPSTGKSHDYLVIKRVFHFLIFSFALMALANPAIAGSGYSLASQSNNGTSVMIDCVEMGMNNAKSDMNDGKTCCGDDCSVALQCFSAPALPSAGFTFLDGMSFPTLNLPALSERALADRAALPERKPPKLSAT